MKENYHTHTYRCGHANGTEREYIERAIAEGLTLLGFSDHIPMPFDDGHESDFRIPLAELDGYIKTISALREEYKDRIKILIGFEAEYYPKYFEKMLAMIAPYDCDYLLLGQHYLYNEEGGVWSGGVSKKSMVTEYVDSVIAGLSTGVYTYLAHPDLIPFTGDAEFYDSEMRRLAEACLKMNIPVEINMLGLERERAYPTDRFFKIAADVGCDVIIGCDAHSPSSVAAPDTLAKAYALAERTGVRLIETPILRKPVK